MKQLQRRKYFKLGLVLHALVPALGGLGRRRTEFKASLNYKVPGQPSLHRERLSQKGGGEGGGKEDLDFRAGNTVHGFGLA